MEVLGGYADTEARETHEPPVQHATHFPNVDYKLACATHGPHPDLLRIRNTFFFHHTQIVVRSHLLARTKDSFLMLKDTLFQQQLNTPKYPRTLVAVHLLKAFTLV